MTQELTDDELLDVPTANLRPGELTRAFLVQAKHREEKHEEDTSRVQMVTAQHVREDEATHEREEIHRREELLLDRIREREEAIFEEAQKLDERTIKLDDGRRVYVDRDKYRDAEGRELKDADRAQAEIHHLDQPNAATWQEHQEIEQKWQAAKQLERKVEKLQDAKSDADAGQALTGYEKEFQGRLTKREAEITSAPTAGSDDYMAAFGLSGSFTQAVAVVSTGSDPRGPLAPQQPRSVPAAASPAP